MNRAYVRVSDIDQNEARQVEALKGFNIGEWYVEKISGKNTNRPELQRLLAEVQPGDTVYVHDFSRLARSTKDLLDIVDRLTEIGVHFHSNKENMDTSTPTGRLLLTMVAAINEFERTNMLERQAEGIRLAKKRGAFKNCGRKEKELDNHLFHELNQKRIAGVITKTAMALELGISRVTLDKKLKEVSLC